jgi:hypothetical protein
VNTHDERRELGGVVLRRCRAIRNRSAALVQTETVDRDATEWAVLATDGADVVVAVYAKCLDGQQGHLQRSNAGLLDG